MASTNVDIAIIGGGIAGLSAAAYAGMNGYSATVFEMADKVGGVCSSWERQGFTINGSIHWLVGSAPGSDLHDMWMELGVLDDHPHLTPARFGIYHDLAGVTLNLWRDPDKLQAHLIEISPEDAPVVSEMCDAIRVFRDNDFPMDRAFELLSLTDWIGIFARNLPMLMQHRRFGQVSLEDYASRFRHPALRGMLEHFWTPGMSMQFLLMQLGFAARGTAAYPLGGSGPFIDRLAARVAQLGARIETGARVTGITVDDGQATGLRLADGRCIRSRHIVAACDAEMIFSSLLPNGADLRPKALDALQPFPSLCYFSAGVTHAFGPLPMATMGHNLPLSTPLDLGLGQVHRATVQIYTFDDRLSPRGSALLTAMLDSDYDWWTGLAAEGKDAYDTMRDRIASDLIAALDQRFPGLADTVVFRDLATPLTFEKYTGNHRGAYEGWLPTPDAAKINLPTHFDGLGGFWMAGHWVAPGGGMPPAAYTGRNAIQLICREEGRDFRVTRP